MSDTLVFVVAPGNKARYAGTMYGPEEFVPFSQEDIAAGIPEQYGSGVFDRINVANLVVAPRRTLSYKLDRTSPTRSYGPGDTVPFSPEDIAAGLPVKLKMRGVLVDLDNAPVLGGTYRAPAAPQPSAGPAAYINTQSGRPFGNGPGAILDAQNLPGVSRK